MTSITRITKALSRSPRPSLPDRGSRRGFALVVTVTMLVLLALIAVGMLTLSTIELRSSGRGTAMQEARSNARLALMMALGELQQQLGPDRRISATSSLYDASPETPEPDGLNGAEGILGVWESWGEWLNAEFETEGGSNLNIRETYQEGRHADLFRRWLVSHSNDALLTAVDTPVKGGFDLSPSHSVQLVGDGTLGSDHPEHAEARAGLVRTGSRGAYAWWIGAENQKAAVHLPKVGRAKMEEVRAGINALSHADARGLDGLGALPVDEAAARHFTNATTGVSLQARGGQAGQLAPHFHALTPHSRSLLVDVRDGGLKRDLSLLFEKRRLPGSYAKAGRAEPGVRPWSPDLRNQRPKLDKRTLFSWERMFAYYQSYRPQRNPVRDRILARAFEPSVSINRGTASVTMFLNKNKQHATGTYNDGPYVRMPVILKHYANLGLQTRRISATPERYAYYINFSPVTVLWNPYNVRLELPSDFLGQTTTFYKNLPMEYKVWVNGNARGGWVNMHFNRGDNTLGGDLQTHFTIDGSTSRRTIVFEPGELLFFSHAQDSAHKWKNAKFQLGYQPQNFDSRRLLIPGLDSLRGRPRVALSLRLGDRLGHNSRNAGANKGAFSVRYTTVKGTLGSNQVTQSAEVTDSDAHMPCWFGIDWFLPGQANQEVIPGLERHAAPFQYADNEPYAIASIGVSAKTAAQPEYPGHVSWVADWRSKNWLHASPAFFGTQLFNPTDRNRAQCPYYLHFAELSGGVDISAVSPHFGDNAILGSGVAGAEQVSFAPVLEIPTRPISSLAGFAGARLLPGWWDESPLSRESSTPGDLTWLIKRMSYHSGVPGVGIGNSFAHPMLEPDAVYTYHDNSECDNRSYTEAFSDYWDHLLLANDALWDTYFLSSIATGPHAGGARTTEEMVRGFFERGERLDNVRLAPAPGPHSTDDIAGGVLSEEGWQRIAAHLMVNGGFNVNSSSLEAWRALFRGLLGRPYVYQKEDGTIDTIIPDDGQAVLSRFHLPTTDRECPDPRVGAFDPGSGLSRWSGVRYIDADQLDRLAEECLKQVKLRGPFLNMSEFINRRLSDDKLGLRGALQAAIDYDDEAPESDSINYRHKGSDDMIAAAEVSRLGYPFPAAATGSRFTGIPGYVVQSDVLQAFGNSLTVRDDTFRIRTYGESRAPSGQVMARAWCEAIVQRLPEYLDPADPPETPARIRDNNGVSSENTSLSETNKRFGRRFELVQFRWLSPEEV